MSREDLRSLEENYDGEFSAYYGRSQGGVGEFFGDVLERRISRRGTITVISDCAWLIAIGHSIRDPHLAK